MLPRALFLLSFLFPSPLAVLGVTIPKTHGVPPALLSKYVPPKEGGAWKCLDGSAEIPWDFVNDDSCDCPDGSDEPGTGACPNTMFYCQNIGHIGSSIPSSRVNDGLCESQCCDGSDERPGHCPNLCKEIGEEYQRKHNEELKIQKTGAKIRKTYIAYAHKEKKRLEEDVQKLLLEIEEKEMEVTRLQEIAERTESLSQAALEQKKKSPLYNSLLTHHAALKSLQKVHKSLEERERALGQILDSLRSGYNPNYQDMAVLEAVRGWEELEGLQHINDVGKEQQQEKEDVPDVTVVSEKEKEEEQQEEQQQEDDGLWTAEQLDRDLNALINTDHVSLLLEHDEYVPSYEGSILFEISGYLPDSILPHYEEFKETLGSWLRKLGLVRGGHEGSADASRALQAFNDASNSLSRLKSELETKRGDVDEIFSIYGFGAEGGWKKLDGLCLDKDEGDYTYEVCLFEEIKQKPNHGGTTFSLGKFDSWNPSSEVSPGEPEYYKKQIYKRGTRCWNGPERNVVLLLTCGTENAIHSVQELEKCEYEIRGTTPALCLPVEANGESAKSRGKKGERVEL